MVYGIYREEEIRMLSHGEIVVGDDGNTKRIVYRRHFMKYDYIPMEQVARIESGDVFLRIKLKDGKVWLAICQVWKCSYESFGTRILL